jgi:hypothetical protein
MSTTITWNISQLDCHPQENANTNVVFTAHWQCNGTDAAHNASVYSTCSIPINTGESFTPYAELTKEQVLDWIWANGVDKEATETAVEQQIENQKNPPVVSPPLPWV